ncbi:uncharacterized protein LOC141623201 [Silene latifolia]|uniref:uncharacterized protein LOC141623201 n=1 Tax=Silene latifolia TaxID=37657 RepID=UPI003D784566
METDAITNWTLLALAFYKRYFPPQKTNALRSQITSFKQGTTEDFNEAWVRFKRLVRSVPHHGFQIWFLCNQFYNGLYDNHRALLDSTANGRFRDNTNDGNAWKLIDNIATHTAKYGYPKGSKRGSGSDNVITAQLEALMAQIAELKTTQSLGNKQETVHMVQQEVSCERCGIDGHTAAKCMSTIEQVQVFQSFKQGTPYSNFFLERSQNVFAQAPQQNAYIIPQNRGNQPQGSFVRQNQADFQQMQPPPQAPSNEMAEMKALLQQNLMIQHKQTAQISKLIAHNKMMDTQVAQMAAQNPSKQPGNLPPQGIRLTPLLLHQDHEARRWMR